MKRIKRKVIALVLATAVVLQTASFTAPETAQAATYNAQVSATGDAVIAEIVTKFSEEGTTRFVFDNLPNVYEVGTYVHSNLPYNIFPYASSYNFGWGTGRQLVIELQDNSAEYKRAKEIIRQEAEAIAAQASTDESRFELAFHQVGDSITYDDSITSSRREQTLYGAILDRVAVCNGYASYMAALLNELGIPAYKVHTTNLAVANDVGHAIVFFYMGDAWHYTDPTSYSFNKKSVVTDTKSITSSFKSSVVKTY